MVTELFVENLLDIFSFHLGCNLPVDGAVEEEVSLQTLLTQGFPGDDPRASLQEILPYEALEDAALASTLAAHNGDLGEVEAEAGEDVLELVDGVDHVLHTTVLSQGKTL